MNLPLRWGCLLPFKLIYTSRQYMTPKLRTFIDFFSEALGQAQVCCAATASMNRGCCEPRRSIADFTRPRPIAATAPSRAVSAFSTPPGTVWRGADSGRECRGIRRTRRARRVV